MGHCGTRTFSDHYFHVSTCFKSRVEDFVDILNSYYRGTHGVIVVYDVQSIESFVNVKRWLHEIEQNCDSVNRILVGNKDDSPEKKVVETSDAQDFAKQIKVALYETSAKDNKNVEEMFTEITKQVLNTKKTSLSVQAGNQDRIKIEKNKKKKKSSGCC